METHFISTNEGNMLLVKEIIDSYNIFQCDKGHKWQETLENRFNIIQPLNFPIPNGDNICPFCFSELLSKLGRISIKMEVK